MPELPEVETVKIGLNKLLPGRVIAGVDYDWPKGFPNSKKDVDKYLIGSKVLAVRRRAKVLMIDLSTAHSLVTHLKMTGQLVFFPAQKQELGDGSQEIRKPRTSNSKLQTSSSAERWGAGHPTNSLVGKLPDKSTRVIITFKNGAQLFFNDQRKFGWMRLIPTIEIPNIDFMKKVGPEPLENDFTADDFIKRLMRRKNSNIKATLLDQTIIAGVGNIYADESLYGAKIHPNSVVSAVPKIKLKSLYESLRKVFELSIKNGGSTDKNYVDATGKKGSYLKFANVFRREGQPCAVCNKEVVKIRVAGRGTHVCPSCQKLYKPKDKK